MPTLEEIAELSDVSRSTVSRVINDDPHVSPATRKKVMSVVRRLNYQPHAAARSLAAGHSRILGLIVPSGVTITFDDPMYSILVRGISATCMGHNYSVMLWLADPDYERRMINQILRNGLIDGVIVSSLSISEEILDALFDSGLSFILVGRHPSRDDVNYVDVENRRGAQEAVGHLLRQGRERVATITGPLTSAPGIDRHTGYIEALRSRGLSVDEHLIVEGDFSEASGYYGMRQLLAHEPDAVFVANDMMALGGLRALREADLRVPEDVAVVGYDDLPLAARATPPLTTVRQPIQRMGAVATQTLIDIIEHPTAGLHRIVLPTELMVRRSCGAMLQP
jgi:LacI family transcriptional regulator